MTALFDSFHRRVHITGHLVTETSLHVGAGGDSLDPTAVDNPVIRLADGRPFIPGSSLKGVLRAFTQRLAESGGGWLRSSGVSAGQCLHTLGENEAVRTLKEAHRGDARALATAIWERMCPVCQLFGGQHFAGRVLVADLLPVDSSPVLERRHGVAIDVDTHTARHGALYDIEAVASGTAFGLGILLENPTEDHVHDLLIGIRALTRGEIALGAKTGSGLGRVRLEDVMVADYGAADLVAAAWSPAEQAMPLAEYLRLHEGDAAIPTVDSGELAVALQRAGARLTWAEAQRLLRQAFGGGGHV